MKISDKAELALRLVREEQGPIAYDTETTGLDWRTNAPVGYVITNSTHSVYIPIRHGGGGNLPDLDHPAASAPLEHHDAPYIVHSFEKALAKAFAQRPGLTVGHNVKFDCHMSANTGIALGRKLADTGVTQALLNEFTKKWTLEAIAEGWNVTAKKSKPMYDYLARKFGGVPGPKQMSEFWRVPGNDPMAVEYAEGDGVTTLELHKAQMPGIEQQDLKQIWQIESDLIWTLFRMERHGMKVDLDYCEQLKEEIEDHQAAAAAALPSGFNSRSPEDVKNLLVSIGRTDWPLTEKGNPQFNEHFLKTFPEGQAILNHRRWNNVRSTFLDPLLQEHVYNGRVHPTLNQLKSDDYGTISGRFSCSRPNLQQIPKRNRVIAEPFRRCFVADGGYRFHERDYSQCEPRLFAHYSKEPALVEGYNATPSRDMHDAVAEMLGVERNPTAKMMNMGMLNGMFPKTFAGHMQWDIDYATKKWNEWYAAFPGIEGFHKQATAVFKQRGYVKTILGRRCRLDKPRFAYKAVSRIIQGSNADILKLKLLEIDKYFEAEGDKAHLLMTIHDSYVYETPEGPEGDKLHEQVGVIMDDVLGDPVNLSVPFENDVGSGVDWAEASFGD